MTTPYLLENFNEAFGYWVDAEKPPRELAYVVFDWIETRYDDPYQGVRRAPGFDNLWYGAVPETSSGGVSVQCSYFIVESEHKVRCDSFAALSEPI